MGTLSSLSQRNERETMMMMTMMRFELYVFHTLKSPQTPDPIYNDAPRTLP
jgi:hypothetical protein